MRTPLKNKRILVTAGPTWVPIDKVRVISNISSGVTGSIISQQAAKKGARVTLVLGPVPFLPQILRTKPRKIRILHFKYFDELRRLLKRELNKNKYDVIIHAAAVSDYKPVKSIKGKIKSGRWDLTIGLKPAIKLIGELRRFAPKALLVMFKLEAGLPFNTLVSTAHKSMIAAKANLVVANRLEDISKSKHKAYIFGPEKRITKVNTKRGLADNLITIIRKEL